ncbi:radical SAM protein [Candidatus Parcubacteria bacterium]|nr:radical SAM protein [Candidatus Parcubacteria bacterium]
MANVCLIYPRDINLNFFPLGLGYIASFLKQKGHNVIFLDLSEKDFYLLKDPKVFNADIVGISITTPQLGMSEKIIKILKSMNSKLPISVGGIHPSFFKDKFLKDYKDVDYVVYGEGEETTRELCDYIDGKIKDINMIDGLIFRMNEKIIINKPREMISDLNSLPFPARELVNYETYLKPPGLIRGIWTKRSANISTSRGCPGRCTYCGVNYIFNRSYRRRSTDNVISEIDFLVREYNIDGLYFMDDTFLMNTEWIEEFTKKFIAKKYNITWSCYGRVDTVNERILKAIKKAGCVQVEYGIESGSKGVLKRIQKNTDIDKIKQAIKMTKENKLRALGSFIFGFVEDTEEDLQESIDLARELNLDFSAAFFATPYPASEIYKQAVLEDRIIEKDLSKWYVRNNNIWRVNLSKEAITKYRNKFLKETRFNNLTFFLKDPKLFFNLIFFVIKNYDAIFKAIKQSFKARSFDDIGYYFYTYLSKDLEIRNKI